jgi:hypothetical protein
MLVVCSWNVELTETEERHTADVLGALKPRDTATYRAAQRVTNVSEASGLVAKPDRVRRLASRRRCETPRRKVLRFRRGVTWCVTP